MGRDYAGIAQWQAEMYIYSCFLYDNGYEHPLDDHQYTAVWEAVKHYYPHLPDKYKQRIPPELLLTPSSLGVWRKEDCEAAFAWFARVKGRPPEKLA